jgi:hypothetical protein
LVSDDYEPSHVCDLAPVIKMAGEGELLAIN